MEEKRNFSNWITYSTLLIFIVTQQIFAQEKLIKVEGKPVLAPKAIQEEETPPPAPIALSDEDIVNVIEFYSQIDPEITAKLKKQESKDILKYDKKIQRLYREYIFLQQLKSEYPERYEEAIELRKLDAQTHKLARMYHKKKEGDEKEKIKEELIGLLRKLFDLKEKEREQEMERIKQRLDRMASELAERRKNKEQIVQSRLDQLTGKGYLHEW